MSPEGYRGCGVRSAGPISAGPWRVRPDWGPLTQRLTADGWSPDVPAKLAARVRVLSTGHGRKTDEADAVSVGIAALTATRLNTASVDAAITLRAWWNNDDPRCQSSHSCPYLRWAGNGQLPVVGPSWPSVADCDLLWSGHRWQRKLRTAYTYSDARVQVAQDRYALGETFLHR